jgi:electron transfer flavoprotein alpha/beta subunit
MKVICLVKQVPAVGAIEFDDETKSLKREGVPLELNPFDRYAVQHGALLGDEVIAMTMGPPQAEEALRECLELGADRAIHLSDRVFAVADTIGTSRTLAMAIQKEGADLVLCGRKALDSETWQVPPEVAAFLRWPHVTNAAAVERSGDLLRLSRQTDFGEEAYEARLPLVVSVGQPSDELPGAGNRDAEIEVWQATDLVDEVRPYDKRFGQPGSPTRVLAVRDSRPERAGIEASTPEEAADAIRRLLDERTPEPPSWEKPDHIAEEPGARYDCWTIGELADGRLRRVSLELIGRSRDLAGKLGGKAIAVLIGHGLDEAAREAGRYGAELVYTIDDPSFAEYHPELWAHALRRVLEDHSPRAVLVPATGRGRDYGPRAAGELELGMTADCVGVDIAKAGRLLQQKPAYGGNIVSVILGATTPQLATVLPRMYDPLEPRDLEVEVRRLELDPPEPRVRLVERDEDDDSYDIDERDIVVGFGPDADPELVKTVNDGGYAVAGTREACEASLVRRTREVGLLGRPIAPRLYVAVEIGDDPEHWAGTVKATVIASIGASVEAADVTLAAEPRGTLPLLLDLVRTAADTRAT